MSRDSVKTEILVTYYITLLVHIGGCAMPCADGLLTQYFPQSVDFQKELLGPQGTASIDYFIFHSVFYIKHSIKQRKT